jgi:hypothetical protein
MAFPFSLALILSLTGQIATTEGVQDKRATRLEFMKASLKVHTVHPVSDPNTIFKLQAEPVMRFNNPVGDVSDGAIFLWTSAHDRPEVAVQIFLHNNGTWYQEFSSLSSVPLAADKPWRARGGGVEFKSIPGAPKPGETAELRLRQIRALTTEFSAEEQLDRKRWQPLRILTKPFARYGKPGTPVVDGVLLACVLTTDPEVYLMIEARQDREGPEWQYAFAPASVAPVKALLNKKEVWSLPYREAWTDRSAPYYVWAFSHES